MHNHAAQPREALTGLSRIEKCVLAALFAVMALLRVVYALHYRIDTDEPQHLHVVWAWAHGQLSYRDVFDNHAPLFHILCAPISRLLGETPMAVIWMRLVLLPLNALSLWCVWRLGKALHSAHAGIWAAVFAGFTPRFFFPSAEFRTDVMWTTLWLGALAILLCKPFTPRRAILFGLLIGAAAGVSMKTTLLLGTLVPAIGIVFLIEALRGNKIAARDPVSNAIAMLLGMAVLPGLLLAFFAWKGALAELRYCVFKHNIVPGLLEVRPIPLQLRPFLFPLIALLSMAGALAILRGRGGWMKPRQAAVLLLASGFYIGALLSYWPVLADEDYLPFFPLLALVAAPLAVHRRNLIPFLRHGPDAGFVLPAAIAALLIAIILWSRPPMKNDTLKEVQLVADVLKLTAPGDYVLDTKGETIFRPRAWYFVMETMTDESVVRGEIYDNIPEELVALCVPVVVSAKMYDRSRAFILANYIRVAHKLKVLGKALPPGRANSRAIRFDVEIPARYVMADEQGLVAGDLDGTPSNGPRLLERGPHTFRPATDSATPMLFWANAWEKGYLPKLHGNK